jgi:pyruvate formate lyase activating enzyme
MEACPAWTSPRTFHLTPPELLERVLPMEPFLDGLTFSGGECTLQEAFLREASRLLKQETRLTVLVDTNGFMDGDVLERLAQEVDGFLFDLKAMEVGTHLRLTGEGNAAILRNLTRAAALGKVLEVRTVVVPGFTDTEAEIRAIARFVRELSMSIPMRLTPFRPHGVRGVERDWPQMDPDRFEVLCDLARTTLGPERVKTAGR